MNSSKLPSRLTSLLFKVFVILFLAIELYPIIWMLLSSFKATQEFTQNPSYSLPEGFYFQNYVDAWTTGKMGIFFKNSLITTVVSLVFIVLFSTSVSFALVKMHWKLRNAALSFFMSGIMVPVTIVLIPLFTMYKQLHLLNTYWSLIITYTGFGLALSVFLISSYMRSLPDELIEAAVIDGCSIYKVFWKVVVPLSMNAIVTVLVIQFFFRWNDMLFSMTFISRTAMKTVQTGLLYFSDEWGNKNWGAIFAAISIGVMPTLGLYAALNKLVIDGMTAGAVKG
jgi:raffinose/stachyose/melibiose transport system permease protein